MEQEYIMVVQKKILLQHGFRDEPGLIKENADILLSGILANHEFMARDIAEENQAYKQIIPYVVVRFQKKFLLLRRLRKQTEARLHDKLSIGVGGHINNQEADGNGNIILKGMYRELHEEIQVRYSRPPVFIGFLNDTANMVSLVHLGAVYVLDADDGAFEVLEKEKMTGSWAGKEEIENIFDHLETWSQIIFPALG